MLTIWSAVILVILLLVLALVYKLVVVPYRYTRYYGNRVTGAPFLPLIGNMLEIRQRRETMDAIAGTMAMRTERGRTFYFTLGPLFRIRTSDPDLVKGILQTKQKDFRKPELMTKVLGPVLGYGLILSEGDVHKRHRRMIEPMFHINKLKAMTPIMIEATLKGLQNMITEQTSSQKGYVDWHVHASSITLDIIGRAAFGTDVSKDEEKTETSIYETLGQLVTKVVDSRVLSLPGLFANFFPVLAKMPCTELRSSRLREDAQIAQLKKVLFGIINKRRERRQGGGDLGGDEDILYVDTLLDHLLDANDEVQGVGGSLTDEEVLDQSMNFILAGHETTSQLITWTLYLLDQSPQWKKKAQEQVHSVIGKNGDIEYEDLSKMSLLTCILYESMRLFPPVPAIVRESVKDTLIGDFEIKEGTTFIVDHVMLHRDPDLWENPDQFDPLRFVDGVVGACKNHSMSFSPFAHGSRNCIGAQFALQEAKIILALVLSKFDWRIAEDYQHWPMLAITLRPKFGMPIFFEQVCV